MANERKPFKIEKFDTNRTISHGPAIAVLCHPSSSTDENYQFVGSITSGSTFTLRWEGGYPYSFATVNRIWEVVFTSGSNQYQINLGSQGRKRTGSRLGDRQRNRGLLYRRQPRKQLLVCLGCSVMIPRYAP